MRTVQRSALHSPGFLFQNQTHPISLHHKWPGRAWDYWKGGELLSRHLPKQSSMARSLTSQGQMVGRARRWGGPYLGPHRAALRATGLRWARGYSHWGTGLRVGYEHCLPSLWLALHWVCIPEGHGQALETQLSEGGSCLRTGLYLSPQEAGYKVLVGITLSSGRLWVNPLSWSCSLHTSEKV